MKISLMYFLILITCSIHFFYAQTDTTAPQTPQGVQAFGYEKNLDVEWYNNQESDLAGYKLYIWSGGKFNFYTNVRKDRSFYSLSMNLVGVGFSFKVSAYDSSGNESPLS